MKTTLKTLKDMNCFDLDKLKEYVTEYVDIEVSILEILNLNGIEDAVKALQTQDYKDYCLFIADVAKSVLHLFENKFPDDNRPRKAIDGIRLFHKGMITRDELDKLRKAAYAAAVDAESVYAEALAYHAASDVYTSDAIAITKIKIISYKATSAAAFISSYAADIYDISNYYIYNYYIYNSMGKWDDIEVLLRKHLKENC